MAKKVVSDLNKMRAIAECDRNLIRCVDTETTGFGKSNEAVSFAIVGEGIESYRLIKPSWVEKWNYSKACEIHGITEEMVKDKPLMAEYMPKIRKALRGSTAMAWNMPFDRQYFHDDLHCAGETICVMRAYKEMTGRKRWCKLTVAAEELGIELPAGEAHNALWDTTVLYKIVLAMLDKLDKERADIAKSLGFE